MSVAITATSVLCPIGRGTPQVWAGVRAGLSGIQSSAVVDREFQPLRLGLVPEDELEPLAVALDSKPLPGRVRRLLRLGGSALGELRGRLGAAPATVYVALPEGMSAPGFLHDLGTAASLPINLATSRLFPHGRAGALAALEAGMQALSGGTLSHLVIGGIDSFLDLRLLAELDQENRLLTANRMEGFIPGEGAAFLLLEADPSAAAVTVVGAATAEDAGHRQGSEPARGEGLANAMDALRETAGVEGIPVTSVFCTLNGEQFDAKAWGVARIRHADLFADTAIMRHPADCFGDTGAASAAILLALACQALASGDMTGRALVWGASDTALRGCSIVESGVTR
jgi:3-oxoacyl-[acyl-carrier-protein] synthase-1